RFLSVDPIAGGPGNVFNFNRYAYASNNPLKFVDPTGMLQQVPHMLDEVMVNGGDCSGCGGGFGGGGYLIPPFVSYDPGAGGRIDRPGGGGGGSHTLAPVNVKANRPADPVVPIDAVRTAQSWYCTPMAASVAGATAGGVVAGALTGMVDLRGNPYGIALGALAGGVASGVIKTASTQLSPYLGSNAGDMLSTALGSAVTDRNPAGVAINGMASYMGNVIGLEPNVAAQMVGRSIPYTAAATLGTAPAIKKGALVAGPMIGLAAGISDYSVEAGWNGYCRN
ncbi:RHS repeat-associated core domain-containing protein, partial [Dyella sp.]|uniref:RHS repeat-associated core domain-containing protein n=1 Tax=Dyella sp. TaxID=1869338 RepID=UPI002B485F15